MIFQIAKISYLQTDIMFWVDCLFFYPIFKFLSVSASNSFGQE